MKRIVILSLVLMIAAIFMAGCSERLREETVGPVENQSEPPDTVIIVIDSTRVDTLIVLPDSGYLIYFDGQIGGSTKDWLITINRAGRYNVLVNTRTDSDKPPRDLKIDFNGDVRYMPVGTTKEFTVDLSENAQVRFSPTKPPSAGKAIYINGYFQRKSSP